MSRSLSVRSRQAASDIPLSTSAAHSPSSSVPGELHTPSTRFHPRAAQNPTPQYPKPIPQEKQERASILYARYVKLLLQEHLAPSFLPIPPHSDDVASQGPASVNSFETYISHETGSLLSLHDSNEDEEGGRGKNAGQPRRHVRTRQRFSPVGRAKTALIRYLGSCSACRPRQVPCPLEHHDIEALSHNDEIPTEPHNLQHHLPEQNSYKANTLLGLGQNPQLLQSFSKSNAGNLETLRDISQLSPYNGTSLETYPTDLVPRSPQIRHESRHSVHGEIPLIKIEPISNGANVIGNAIDWTTGVGAAVAAAYVAAYGTCLVLPALLPKLQSIFDDPTFKSFVLEQGSSNDGLSQHAGSIDETSYRENQSYPSSDLPVVVSGFGSKGNTGSPGGKRKGAPKVKATKSGTNPSDRVFRRLRCHFNARSPQKYCVTRSTGDRYHVCSKSGYLTIAHLKQHNRSTHEVSRCARCGRLFEKLEERDDHSRVDSSRICDTVPVDQWPGIDQAENINETIQARITINLTSRGYQVLSQATKDAIALWISANIAEYVGDNPTSQDRLELRNWYLIWLALFPGIAVPSHPFSDGQYPASIEDGRFRDVFQTVVHEQVAAGRMTPISSDIMDQILMRIQETQIIVGTMSRAAQNVSLGERGQNGTSTTWRDTLADRHGPVNHTQIELTQRRPMKRQRHSSASQSTPTDSFQSSHLDTLPSEVGGSLQEASSGSMPISNIHHGLDSVTNTAIHRGMHSSEAPPDMNIAGYIAPHMAPWSSNTPRYTGPQQAQATSRSYDEIQASHENAFATNSFGGTSDLSQDFDPDTYSEEWFDPYDFGSFTSENNGAN